MKKNQSTNFIKVLSLSAISLALTACGSSSNNSGESGVTPPTPPETVTFPSVLIGELTAISTNSVTVNQQEVPASNAEVEIDGVNASLSQLQVGMMVEVETNGSAATEIDYDPNFKGPVLIIEGTSASIAGVALEEFDSSQVASGDLVEVSGFNSAYNQLTVTYQQPITNTQSELEIEGVINALNTQVRTFTLGNITVNYQNAEVDGLLSNGQLVEVEGIMNGQQLMASEVDAEQQNDFTDNVDTELKGKITWLNNDATLMTINGQWQVSLTEQTIYEDGAASDLAVGAVVDVEAVFQKENNLFVAQDVEFEFKPNGSTVVNKTFSVAGISTYNQGSVTINGLTFIVNNQTFFDNGLTAANIDGQFLELEGIIADDGSNIVSEVELMDANDSLDLTGDVIANGDQQPSIWGYESEDGSLSQYLGQYVDLECDFVSGNQVRACHLDD